MSRYSPSLIENIYEAALDPTQWASVLSEIRDHLGANAYSLFTLANEEGQKPELLTSNIDPEWSRAYREYWWQHDQWVAGAVGRGLMIPSQTVSGDMLVDPGAFAKGVWFNEALKPQDLGDLLSTTLWSHQGDPHKVVLSFYRSPRADHFGKSEFDYLEKLSSHLQRALKLTLAGARQSEDLQRQASILDGISHPVLILDDQRKILSMNEAAERLIGNPECPAVHVRGNRLIELGERSTPSLEKAVQEATHLTGRPIPMAFIMTTPEGVRVSGSAHVMKLHQPPTAHFRLEGQNRFMVQLEWTETPVLELLHLFGDLFGLSPAELRVLNLLMGDYPPQAIADHLKLSLPTVRTHLQRIRQKTGTRRHGDLIRLVLATSQRH